MAGQRIAAPTPEVPQSTSGGSDDCASGLGNKYILIPEDLFRDFTRCPTTIDLTLRQNTDSSPRTAGIYPLPRPLPVRNCPWKRSHTKCKDYKVIGVPIRENYCVMAERTLDNDPDDVIAMVARANQVEPDYSNVLPQLQASSCLMHSKSNSRRQHEHIYSTSYHGGTVPGQLEESRSHKDRSSHTERSSSHKDRSLHTERSRSHKDIPIYTHGSRSHTNGSSKQSAHKPQTFLESNTVTQVPSATTLWPTPPDSDESKDLVMSWLVNGSAPVGEHHFPDIVNDGQKAKNASKMHQRSSLLSE